MTTKTMTTKSQHPIPRNAYSPRRRVVSPCGEGAAQQQFRDDCDVNIIMQRYQKTGAIDHVSKHQPEYGFATPNDYHQSMNIITTANSMFNDLPSNIRNEFSNNPQAFLKFVQDPKNADRAKELGLELSPQAAEQAASEPQDAAKPDEVEGSLQDAGTPDQS